MSVDVTAFSAMARAEFQQGMLAAFDKPYPANYANFTTEIGSTAKVETHTYMSNLPRLVEWKRSSPVSRLENKEYVLANKDYRIGPIQCEKNDLDDEQTSGYLATINAMPGRAQKDIGHLVMAHLAAGTSRLCFDGTAMFAASHTFGTGDNLDVYNCGSNADGTTHYIVALITDNSAVKPVLFQNREPLTGLKTDADTMQADLMKSYQYWADTRFGLGYGYWWDAYHLTITDTPTVEEAYEIIRQIINGFRTFTLPKGRDTDDSLYVHEGWEPMQSSFYLCTSLKVAEIIRTAVQISQYVTSTGNVDNVYKNVATVVPTSALARVRRTAPWL